MLRYTAMAAALCRLAFERRVGSERDGWLVALFGEQCTEKMCCKQLSVTAHTSMCRISMMMSLNRLSTENTACVSWSDSKTCIWRWVTKEYVWKSCATADWKLVQCSVSGLYTLQDRRKWRPCDQVGSDSVSFRPARTKRDKVGPHASDGTRTENDRM